jgi:uncharacterized protein (DUF433 family)
MNSEYQAIRHLNNENILSFFREGHTLLEVSNKFSIPTNEIYGRINSLLSITEREQIRNQKKTIKQDHLNEKISLINELFQKHHNIQAIANETGIPSSRIKRIIILEMLRNGETITDVANVFETTPENIYGLAARSLTADERKHIKENGRNIKQRQLEHIASSVFEDHLNGSRPHDIAKKYSILISEVKRIIRNYGFPVRSLTPDERKQIKQQHLVDSETSILEDHKKNMSMSDIAKRYSISPSDVKRIIKKVELFNKETQILDLLRSGISLEETGRQFNLSRERIRQIASKYDFNTIKERTKSKQSIALLRSTTEQEISNWVKSHPGCTIEEISAISNEFNEEVIPKEVHHLILNKSKTNTWTMSKFSKDEIVAALRQAADILNSENSSTRSPLTRSYFDKIVLERELRAPSSVRIMQMFGTWSEACSTAGVQSVKAFRSSYIRTWSDSELLDLLGLFLQTSKLVSTNEFDKWCGTDPTKPGSGTLRNQIGLWSECKNLALLQLRATWIS